MKDKFLPIGSVVLLKDASKKIMITGFLSVDENDQETIYDYVGCVYPEGFLKSSQILLFNHDQIDKVFFEGYINDEQIAFSKKLIEFEKGIEEK